LRTAGAQLFGQEVAAVPEDRRVRRTRRALREALLALIAEKGYDRVTVQDVLDRADLGRATFYAHFRDKDDLLASGFEELRETLRAAMALYEREEIEPPAEGFETSHALFEHVAAHRQLYRALVGSRAGGLVLRDAREQLVALTREHLERVIVARGGTRPVPVEILAEYTVGALLGMLTSWLDNGTPYPARQMAATFERLTTPALEIGLGLTEREGVAPVGPAGVRD
jgi:AcrR family transcriptional regulator